MGKGTLKKRRQMYVDVWDVNVDKLLYDTHSMYQVSMEGYRTTDALCRENTLRGEGVCPKIVLSCN